MPYLPLSALHNGQSLMLAAGGRQLSATALPAPS